MRIESEARDGPAITSVEYRVDPNTSEEFLEALKDLKRIRLRDGAIRWNVLRDSADPERYLEVFVTESWGEHLRQHERNNPSEEIGLLDEGIDRYLSISPHEAFG